NGCHAKRRERKVSRESQCDAKKFCMRPSPREGVWKRQKSKVERSKIAKIELANSRILRKKKGKPKVQEIARSAFMPVPERRESPSAGRISIPPLTASYWL